MPVREATTPNAVLPRAGAAARTASAHDPARVRRCHRLLLQLSDLDSYGFYGLELESQQVCRLPVIKPVTSVGDCAIG